MSQGRCPSCGRTYSPRDVEAYGVLRARAAHQGGPRVEYRCVECGRLIHLVPHGRGRYAPPGEPPGPPPTDEDLRPPWLDGDASPPPPVSWASEVPPEAAGAVGGAPEPEDEEPLGLEEARALLGVGPGVDAASLDRAFRERSLTCHPDKAAHLDEEIQAVARARFVRLRAAYELLQTVVPTD